MNQRMVRDCKVAYDAGLFKYFPKRHINSKIERFFLLATLLEQENIDCYKYIGHWFGIWESSTPPSPEHLAHPVFVLRFRKQSS